jgi:sigma-B regulation protein RsbU (phosphoserine phosphatase)
MKIISRLSWITFYGLSAIVGIVSIFCVIKVFQWVNQPFAGFLAYAPPYVGSFSSRDWNGKQAGIQYLDRIVRVDWQEVRSGQEIVDIVRQKHPGTVVHYQVESKGELREVDVPVALFGWKDFIVVFFPPVITGIAIYILGVIVYLLKPNTRTSWVFLVMCFGISVYGITGFEIQSSYLFMRLHYLTLSLFPFCFIHLGLIFPERKRLLQRWPLIEYLLYVPPLLLGIAYQVYFTVYLNPDAFGVAGNLSYLTLSTFARIFALLGSISLIAFVLHSLFRSQTVLGRTRAKMMIFGVAVAFLPVGILMMLAHTLKVFFPFNFVPIFVIFFPLFIAYSIIRHNMFDADIIIRRTVGYAIVTLIVVAAYIGLSLSVNVMLGRSELAHSRLFPILFTLAIILVFNPLRERIQAVVDRVFFRKEYDYSAVVEKIGGAITTLMELGEILDQLVDTFLEDMFIDTSSVILLDKAGKQYKVRLAAGDRRQFVENVSIDQKSSLINIIEGRQSELTREDVLEDPKFASVSKDCAAHFDALSANLLIPMVFQKKIIGILSLGDKKSGKSYNREDIELLRTIAQQGAVAIENAMLFQENLEKQRMEEELNIARDLQMSMLPADCPEMEGFQIAAVSTQAKEVGGDFYDFIQMEGGRIGIVIGDVTGKSVSGALVMAASRSVFRLLSEDRPSVGDIMTRANRRIKKDIISGMFVALLYAVIDPVDKTLAMCSAGQTQPFYCKAGRNEAVLMETEGDNFPLGLLDDADYMETRIPLNSGDKVIFYTDGIVEAMNAGKELYGFERLNAAVEKAAGNGARELLDAILTDVGQFVEGADQHDDLTVIVLSVS